MWELPVSGGHPCRGFLTLILTWLLTLRLRCRGGSVPSLILRANRAAQPKKQNNREKRPNKPRAQQLNGIH